MRKLSQLLCLAALAACHRKPVVAVVQPIIVGSAGRVYQTTEAENSVDVVNNSRVVGDILVGETMVYEGVEPNTVRNIGFACNGMILLEGGRHLFRQTGSRTEYVHFVPQNMEYEIKSKSVSVRCGQTHPVRKSPPFTITTLRRKR